MFRNYEKIFQVIDKSLGHSLWTSYTKMALINSSIPYSTSTLNLNKVQKVPNEENNSAKMLQQLLDMRPLVANDLVSKYKKFSKISEYAIEDNFKCSIKNGILKDTLQKFPEVLAESDILLKIAELKETPFDINTVTPLLSLPYKHLKTFLDREIKASRIKLLSQLLEIPEVEVCKILVRRSFLLSLNSDQLTNNLKLLIENGITKEQIIKDLWVLRYSTNVIKERLDLAKKNNVEVFKTWMVRAQLEIFETYIRRRSDNKLILGNSSLTQYLSERLECTEEVAKYIISKQPALQNKSLKKMNEMIDFLYKYGFKPIHISKVPKILLHSVETTRKRLKELESRRMHLDSLYILTKSQRQYLQYCELLVKNKKKV